MNNYYFGYGMVEKLKKLGIDLSAAYRIIEKKPDDKADFYVPDTDTYFCSLDMKYFDHSTLAWEKSDFKTIQALREHYGLIAPLHVLNEAIKENKKALEMFPCCGGGVPFCPVCGLG